MHQRDDRRSLRRHGAAPRHEEDLRVHRREGLAGSRGRHPLSLHGAEGDRERDHPLSRCPRPEGEPSARGGARPEARARDAQHGPSHAPRLRRGVREAMPRDLPRLGQRARPVGTADRPPRRDRAAHRGDGGDGLRDGGGLGPRLGDGRHGRPRHPPRSGGRQDVELRGGLEARGPHAPDPRRPRLRDGRFAAGARREADSRRADDARLPHQPHLRGLVGDHAALHRARGARPPPRGRGRPLQPESPGVAKDREGPAAIRRLLREVVPDALARLGPRAAVFGVRSARRPRPLPRAHDASALPRALPHDGALRAEAREAAGAPLPCGGHRRGPLRHVGRRQPRAGNAEGGRGRGAPRPSSSRTPSAGRRGAASRASSAACARTTTSGTIGSRAACSRASTSGSSPASCRRRKRSSGSPRPARKPNRSSRRSDRGTGPTTAPAPRRTSR